MRRLILAVVLASGAGWVMAQDPPAAPPAQPPQQPAATAKDAKDTKEMTAVVVATDPMLKTITVKQEGTAAASGPSETTLPVDEKALANLKSVKVGEKVKLVLKTDAMGKDSVTSIKSKTATPEK